MIAPRTALHGRDARATFKPARTRNDPNLCDIGRGAGATPEHGRDAHATPGTRIRAEIFALANPDPELEEELNRKHPVAERASELSVRVHVAAEERGWIPAGANREHPVVDLVSSAMSAAAKFAGALNGRRWPPSVHSYADSIVRLKRARGFLDDALRAAECCAEQQLVDPAWLADAQRELSTLAQDGDRLIAELRETLARGFDKCHLQSRLARPLTTALLPHMAAGLAGSRRSLAETAETRADH